MLEKEERIRIAQSILTEMEKSIKVFQMYEERHPSTRKALDRLYEKFVQFLNDNDTLILRVGQFEFFYEDAMVYQNLERTTSMAFKLFRDGLRGIGFENGMSVEEMIEVMKLFNADFGESEEDDIVTKLWEKNLPHIQYWEAEEETQPPELIELKAFELLPGHGVEEKVPDAEISLAEVVLSNEEIERLKTEVESLEQIGISSDLVDIFEHLLKNEDDLGIKSKLMDNFPGLVFNLLTRNNFRALNHCLTIFKNIKDYVIDVDLKTRRLIANIIARLQTEMVILGLAPELEKGNSEIEVFLSFLGKEIIEPLFKLLDVLTRNAGRDIVIRGLARLTKDNKSPVLSRLQDSDIARVKIAILILETIGDEEGIGYLRRIVKRPELELRKFLVETIGGIRVSGVQPILIEALEDPDPEIRVLSLKQMSSSGDGFFVAPLMKIINDKEFKKREMEEKRAFFYALADCGSGKVVGFFQRVLKKRAIFNRKKLWELKQIAAFALVRINEPEVDRILNDGLKGRDRRMRELCTKAKALAMRKE